MGSTSPKAALSTKNRGKTGYPPKQGSGYWLYLAQETDAIWNSLGKLRRDEFSIMKHLAKVSHHGRNSLFNF
jgi:hypothetical protein